MPTGAAIGGASLIGGLISSSAAHDASKAQAESAGNALAFQKQTFDTTQKNLQPFMDTGKGAMYSLAQLYGIGSPGGSGDAFNDNALAAFRKAPDYDWRMKEGMRALDFSDSAKGSLASRGHLNRTVEFGQGLAGQGLGDYTSRLLALSNIGASAASGGGNIAANMSGTIGNTMMGQGQATASGIVGGANALNAGLSGGVNNLMMYNAINRRNSSAYDGGDAYGGNGVYGGSSMNPLPGLNALDYGAGY
jgi:hypothetical protein